MKNLVLSLLALSLAAAGCASRSSGTDRSAVGEAPAAKPAAVIKSLAGTRWALVSLDGAAAEPAVAGWPAQSLQFDADGKRATGHAGVNRFGGRFEQNAGGLRFGPLAMTRRAGPPAQMEIERRYTVVLSAVTGWRQEGANLILVTPASDRAAVLAPSTAKAE
jgi:heat shock protein HslJ